MFSHQKGAIPQRRQTPSPGRGDSATATTVARNVAVGNGYENFAILSASGNELVGNTARGGQYEGISLYHGADNNVIRDNLIIGNRTSGILLYELSHNELQQDPEERRVRERPGGRLRRPLRQGERVGREQLLLE
ncbi:MAG: NosD domain-containing protein [Actinomycetota bacterium]